MGGGWSLNSTAIGLCELRLEGLAQAEGLPRTKWGIPEPTADLAATMADVTGSSELTLLLVPGVAFDARCGRVGHGRGYYDAFISRQRGLERPAGAEVLVVGLALAPLVLWLGKVKHDVGARLGAHSR